MKGPICFVAILKPTCLSSPVPVTALKPGPEVLFGEGSAAQGKDYQLHPTKSTTGLGMALTSDILITAKLYGCALHMSP